MNKRLKLGQRLPDRESQCTPVYAVNGMPAGHRARIESANSEGTGWRVDHYMDGHGWRFMGEYPTATAALAGLEEHLESLD